MEFAIELEAFAVLRARTRTTTCRSGFTAWKSEAKPIPGYKGSKIASCNLAPFRTAKRRSVETDRLDTHQYLRIRIFLRRF